MSLPVPYQTLTTIINQALQLDAYACQRLQKLAHQSIRVECQEPAFDMLLSIKENGTVLLHASTHQSYATHIKGPLSAFLQLLKSSNQVSTMMNSGLYISGNSQLLQQLSDILKTVDIDWEFYLAQKIGDIPAHVIGKIGRQSQQWLQQKQPFFIRHLQEFILEETRLSPRHEELEQFIEQTQQLKYRTELLDAKIQRLTQGKKA